ncbi:hypothetical protein [Streptomyces sp. NBC_00670]|jgi:hypothetical protein|uniref:hypothetical protein n=1 Tax=Streptomyces sp. NBC_00670 TaxID=2975804 RepID=UPI002E371E37|nr:hypothetical protein [Streptomyces sp. NBC_00670]
MEHRASELPLEFQCQSVWPMITKRDAARRARHQVVTIVPALKQGLAIASLGRVPKRFRRALWARRLARTRVDLYLNSWLGLAFIGFMLCMIVVMVWPSYDPLILKVHFPHSLAVRIPEVWRLPGALGVVLYCFLIGFAIWRGFVDAGHRYRLIEHAALVVIYAGKAADRDTDAAALHALSTRLHAFGKSVITSHVQAGTIPSHARTRHRTAVNHARRVVARLRSTEAGLDTNREDALRELVTLVMQISDSYLLGHLAALLPEEEIKDMQPVRDHPEIGRMVGTTGQLLAAAAVFVGLPWLLTHLGWAAPYSYGAAALGALIVLVPAQGRHLFIATAQRLARSPGQEK